MKVILINIPWTTIKNYEHSVRLSPPIGLAYIASYLREHNISVKIIDALAEGYEQKTTCNKLIRYGLTPEQIASTIWEKPDFIGISCPFTSQSNNLHDVARALKNKFDVPIIAGGAHISALYEQVLKDKNIDIAIIGEGEETFLELTSGRDLYHINGIAFRAPSGDVIKTSPRAPITRLDKLPYPAYDLLPLKTYWKADLSPRSDTDKKWMPIVTSRGCPYNCCFCFLPGSEVFTKQGMKKIEEIRKDDEVLTHTGKYQKVKEKLERSYTGNIIKFKPHYINTEIACTENHKILIMKKPEGKHIWIESKDLTENDYVLFPIPTENDADINKIDLSTLLSDIKIYKEKLSDNNCVELTPEFCRLIGYYLAEGHVTKQKDRPGSYRFVLTFNKNERKLIDDAKNIFKKHFWLELREYPNIKNNTIQLSCHNIAISLMFKRLFGDDCYTKHLPTDFISLPKIKIIEILKGWILGDGGYVFTNKVKKYSVCSVSYALIKQMQYLFLKLGIIPYFSVYNQKSSKQKSLAYELVFSSFSLYNLIEIMKFDCTFSSKFDTGHRYISITKKYIGFKIKSIKKENYSGLVHNLSVNKDESYTCSFVSVKNCSVKSSMGSQYRYRSAWNVINEIAMLKKLYGIEHIFFEDDNLSYDINRAQEIFRNLSPLNITWETPNGIRADKITPELLTQMKASGCKRLTIAVESGDQKFLNEVIHKKISLEQIEQTAKLIRDSDIDLTAFYIFGITGETEENAGNTISFARKLARLGVRPYFNVAVPLPNTELYNIAKANNLLTKNNFEPIDYLTAMQIPLLKNSDIALKHRKKASILCAIELLLNSPRSLLKSESFVRLKKSPLKALKIFERGTC